MDIECGGLTFVSNFDSSNIDRVELVSRNENGEPKDENESSILEFNIWTKADCAGTEFANNNRTWFHFGVKGGLPCTDIKLNVVNLNKQGKLYNQGMAPVFKVTPEPNRWERVRDYLSFDMKNNLLSFGYRTLENLCSTTYFAFTYPYSFVDLQNSFKHFDALIRKMKINPNPLEANPEDIYFHRECVIKSLEGRPIDLITISSHYGITNTREPRLEGLFPDTSTPRSYQFKRKKVIFLSARVHPGETPSSFVMNGVLHLLLNKTDTTAIALRKLFVFKLIPMLNPDGVSKGYYRTDTRGVNLNRLYLNPSEVFHPSVFAARSLILYYHYGYEKKLEPSEYHSNEEADNLSHCPDQSLIDVDNNDKLSCQKQIADSCGLLDAKDVDDAASASDTETLKDKVAEISMSEPVNEPKNCDSSNGVAYNEHSTIDSGACSTQLPQLPKLLPTETRQKLLRVRQSPAVRNRVEDSKRSQESGLFMYVDFHGHASKRGIFMYGNHFDNVNDKVECLLLPKLLSINNAHFHYNQCNFSKRNMYTKDRRDGLSKEGCGRVAVLKYTGLVRSYTLECNYNTGCIVNIIPPTQRPLGKHLVQPVLVPPKYTPQIYEEVGRALCVSILDMMGANLNSRLPATQFKNINGLRESLRYEIILAKNAQRQPNLKMRQSSISLLQRGNKNFPTTASKRKILKRMQSKCNMFPEIPTPSQSFDSATHGSRSVKRKNSTGILLHTVKKRPNSNATNVCLSKSTSKLTEKRVVGDIPKMRKLTSKKFGNAFKIEKKRECWPNKMAETTDWGAPSKRKIEKKISHSGGASTSARPPNKKRRKSLL